MDRKVWRIQVAYSGEHDQEIIDRLWIVLFWYRAALTCCSFEGVHGMEEASIGERRDSLKDRLLQSVLGTFEVFSIHIGDRLAFYRMLADCGPSTSAELAARTGTHERYVREWLEQQTLSGILDVEGDITVCAQDRRYRLPPSHAEVLASHDSVHHLAPLAQMVVGATQPLEALLAAYRTGSGVPFQSYGGNMREGMARLNRPMFLNLLGSIWFPSIPDVHFRLQTDPPARIADICCGMGWSSIGFAQSYPNVTVDGFDMDEPSIEAAREHAEAAGLTDRVRFHVCDASDSTLAGRYDLVVAFECIHDLADPVGGLRTMRRLAGENGAVIVVDERVRETFMCEDDPVERFNYGFSVLHCLPVGMTSPSPAGTGAVMRPEKLRSYSIQAGFDEVEVLPVDNFFLRFYRLKTLYGSE